MLTDVLTKRSLFREVNRQVRSLNASFSVVEDSYSVLCECGRSECLEWVEVPERVYAEVCKDETVFVVAEDHAEPDERLVSDGGAYFLVAPAAAAPA